MDEIFICLLFLLTVTRPNLLTAVYFTLSLLLLYSPRVRSKFALIKAVLFTHIALLSLFQLPLLPDATHLSAGWRLLFTLFGFEKWSSDVFDGRAMCMGDGILRKKGELVECTTYSSFSAMGLYVTILVVFYLYVGESEACEA